MPLFVERASYSTKGWETIAVLNHWNEMRHIADRENPRKPINYVFGYSPEKLPLLTRVVDRVIEEMYVIEPNKMYEIQVSLTSKSSKRTIRFRLVE